MKRDTTRARARGWRRRIRAFDRYALTAGALPPGWAGEPDRLSAQHMPVAGNWPFPFPIALRRRVVAHLVETYDRWHAELQRAEEPLYLGIWLFEPHFGECRVVAARKTYGQMFTERHLPGSGGHPCDPPPLYDGLPLDLSRFEWTHYRTVDHERVSDYAPGDRRRLLREARRHTPAGDGDTLVALRSDSWYGWLAGDRERAMPLLETPSPDTLRADGSGRFRPP